MIKSLRGTFIIRRVSVNLSRCGRHPFGWSTSSGASHILAAHIEHDAFLFDKHLGFPRLSWGERQDRVLNGALARGQDTALLPLYTSPRNNMSDRLRDNIISLPNEPIFARILSRLSATILSTMI